MAMRCGPGPVAWVQVFTHKTLYYLEPKVIIIIIITIIITTIIIISIINIIPYILNYFSK